MTGGESDLVELIRARMRAEGWSVRALARAAGVHPSAVSRVLNRRRLPTWRWLARVGPLLGFGPREWALAGMPVPARGPGTSLEDQLRLAAGLPPDLLDRLRQEYERLKTELRAGCDRAALARRARAALDRAGDTGWRRRLEGLVQQLEAGRGEAAVAAGAALRYWLLEADLVPDDHIPGGFLDDALVVAWAEAEGR
ncbi:protein of unknown function [Candidatus Hydrogenisulfobacillus filiaventi]|uniref:HTH cro/C1-type domain-containing protein n=1 Tax=Candidatus Hydrogenisulfobacillus filiaventi TaxID=2707344 RepID=A0A6F8ZEN5_9FIRM|nr:helix-turn-helix domain-containing protein [Bacillota bacterium]CAB1128215.1 protein of unknown function [Candidatus Hydrogenisulfobacillus filiaventi]